MNIELLKTVVLPSGESTNHDLLWYCKSSRNIEYLQWCSTSVVCSFSYRKGRHICFFR